MPVLHSLFKTLSYHCSVRVPVYLSSAARDRLGVEPTLNMRAEHLLSETISIETLRESLTLGYYM